jgi:gluconate 2-dehydrogenase gamma chain
MEKGELPAEYWKETNQTGLFRLMLDHTMQGFYGSPRHGGNVNYVELQNDETGLPACYGTKQVRIDMCTGTPKKRFYLTP